jgi:signal transduction histidine kinase
MRLRPAAMLAALILLGAAGALAVAAALGMKASELAHLAGLLVPATLVTIVAATLATILLRRTSLRQRYLAIAAVGTVVALGNVVALTWSMFVSAQAATVLIVVLVYASAAGLAAAFASARSSASALERVTEVARTLGEGDPSARVGALEAGPELDRLGETLDRMAGALQEARDQQQRAERTRRDLITAVSHDLRTPLANLRAMTEAIDEGVVDDRVTLGRYVVEMRRSVGQLSAMVDDLFELVQVDAIAIEAETERARLDQVVASALATVEQAAERKGVRVAAEIGDVEDTTCSPHLIRVLQNLLVNAVRHTPADGTVRVAACREPDLVRLVVEDTGPGIADADLPHVFDPFFRGDAARSGDGSGLGLTLADRIVRAMGGTIEVENLARAGARFDVVVPLGPELTTTAAPPGSARTRSGGRPGSGSRRPS